MRRLIGKNAMWRYDEKAPKAEERETLRAQLPTLGEVAKAAAAALCARREELLRDPQYLALKADYDAAKRARDNALSSAHHYRVTIGRDTGYAMMVEAQGDNWQEAIDALKAKVAATIQR